MKSTYILATAILIPVFVTSCSGKQPKGKSNGSEQADAGPNGAGEQDEQLVSAQTRIRDWLGQDLTQRISSLGKDLGGKIGQQLAADAEVMGKAKGLSKTIFSDPVAKKELAKISDKATSGFGNKLNLGWKALRAGGINAYKKKVREDAMRVAVEVLGQHVKDNLLKDERMTRLLKEISPAMKMQGKIVAASVQENMSARATKKILAIVLRIAAAGDNAKMAARVEAWIERCDDHAGSEVEKLIVKTSELSSVKQAVRNLAIDVLGHERTKIELTTMIQNLVQDKEVNKSLVKVYEAAAFDKGDTAIKNALLKTLELPIVDQELFAAMERLGTAKGASGLIGRRVGAALETTEAADIVENFIMAVLEGCGDPTEDPPT